jgi:hypothetical protein
LRSGIAINRYVLHAPHQGAPDSVSEDCLLGHKPDEPPATHVRRDPAKCEVQVTGVINREQCAALEWNMFGTDHVHVDTEPFEKAFRGYND